MLVVPVQDLDAWNNRSRTARAGNDSRRSCGPRRGRRREETRIDSRSGTSQRMACAAGAGPGLPQLYGSGAEGRAGQSGGGSAE